MRLRHYSRRTEDAYVAWMRRYIVFHGKRHPTEMGSAEIAQYLSWLAVKRRVSASTQNQALSALLFLYREVLHVDVTVGAPMVRARGPERLPVVLSRSEAAAVMATLRGRAWIMVALLYGAGLRLRECLELRVKDLDLARQQIVVRRGKGQKDRVTVLPVIVKERLLAHLEAVRKQHEKDLQDGFGRVMLPDALERQYPGAATDWRWQFVFPAAASVEILAGGRRPGITSTIPSSSELWRRRYERPASPSGPAYLSPLVCDPSAGGRV